MQYKSKLVITKKKLVFVNTKMDLVQITEDEYDQTETIATIPFNNGNELDIKLCSGNTNYFIDMVLFSENGFELMCWAPDDLGDPIEFEYDDDEYIINLEII